MRCVTRQASVGAYRLVAAAGVAATALLQHKASPAWGHALVRCTIPVGML
jgi:hypothetical protein